MYIGLIGVSHLLYLHLLVASVLCLFIGKCCRKSFFYSIFVVFCVAYRPRIEWYLGCYIEAISQRAPQLRSSGSSGAQAWSHGGVEKLEDGVAGQLHWLMREKKTIILLLPDHLWCGVSLLRAVLANVRNSSRFLALNCGEVVACFVVLAMRAMRMTTTRDAMHAQMKRSDPDGDCGAARAAAEVVLVVLAVRQECHSFGHHVLAFSWREEDVRHGHRPSCDETIDHIATRATNLLLAGGVGPPTSPTAGQVPLTRD